jgi:hypothetical protein
VAASVVVSGCTGTGAQSVAASPWDQAAVTALAKQLTPITEKLYTGIYQEGQMLEMPSAMGAGDDYAEFKESIREMNEEAMHLNAALEKGKGMADTRPIVEHLGELNDDAKEYVAEQFTESPVNDDLAALEKVIGQLGAFYGL